MPRVLLIAKNRAKDEVMENLVKDYTVTLARSGKQGLAMLPEETPHVIVLDAVSMRTTGDRICRSLKVESALPVVHIHPGPEGEAQSAADVLLFHPVSGRRVANSVGRLLNHGKEDVLRCGPFAMNVTRRILVAHGKETQLTPKLALLLEIFFRNPGEIVDRKTIMETVWETNYLGDTRTLDVHIRWIRQLMEAENAPRYLKTVRGVGYRLVIPAK